MLGGKIIDLYIASELSFFSFLLLLGGDLLIWYNRIRLSSRANAKISLQGFNCITLAYVSAHPKRARLYNLGIKRCFSFPIKIASIGRSPYLLFHIFYIPLYTGGQNLSFLREGCLHWDDTEFV